MAPARGTDRLASLAAASLALGRGDIERLAKCWPKAFAGRGKKQKARGDVAASMGERKTRNKVDGLRARRRGIRL